VTIVASLYSNETHSGFPEFEADIQNVFVPVFATFSAAQMPCTLDESKDTMAGQFVGVEVVARVVG